jgi:hypothetical protein
MCSLDVQRAVCCSDLRFWQAVQRNVAVHKRNITLHAARVVF